MKRNIAIICFLVNGCLFSSCMKDEISLPSQPLEDYIKVYMPQAVSNPVVYSYTTSDTSTHTIIYGANYGGAGYPEEDVQIHFGVNAAAIDSFNMANGTQYTLLPAKSYKLSDTVAVIKKGTLSTDPLKLSITTYGENAPTDISKTYILPITIKNASIKINESLQTFFCVVKIDPTYFNRSNWVITGFSSQESDGEGPNNGKAIFILDGNNGSFWHSQWKGGQPGPPHYITIDMGSTQLVRGCVFVPRQSSNSGKPRDVQIFLSTDGNTWNLAFAQTSQNTTDLQRFFFDQGMEGRFVKMQINSAYGATYTHLAEFYLF